MIEVNPVVVDILFFFFIVVIIRTDVIDEIVLIILIVGVVFIPVVVSKSRVLILYVAGFVNVVGFSCRRLCPR